MNLLLITWWIQLLSLIGDGELVLHEGEAHPVRNPVSWLREGVLGLQRYELTWAHQGVNDGLS